MREDSITLKSSHRRCSVRKDVLRNFTKFTGKHQYLSLLFNKVTGLQACNFIKKETLAQVPSCEFCEISNKTFFTEYLWATASERSRLKITFFGHRVYFKATTFTEVINK